jgi:hypothetical protein
MFGASNSRISIFFIAAGILFVCAGIFAGCALLPAFNSTQAIAVSSPTTSEGTGTQTPIVSAEPASPSPSPAVSPTSTATTSDTPAANSDYSEAAIAGYSISIVNPYAAEAHIFINNEYVLTIPPGSSGALTGIQSGTHTFHYCQAVDQLECASPESINITGNAEWKIPEISENVPESAPLTTTPQPDAGLSPTPNATPTVIPTARVMRGTFYTLKINNPNRWMMFVFMNDELFLSIPKRKYRTFRSLPAGTYTLEYCWNKEHKLCFRTVEVAITGDTEIWAHP